MRPNHHHMPPAYQAPSAMLFMPHVASPVAIPTFTASNPQLSPGLPPSYSYTMEHQSVGPRLSNMQNVNQTSYSSTAFATTPGLPQSLLGNIQNTHQASYPGTPFATSTGLFQPVQNVMTHGYQSPNEWNNIKVKAAMRCLLESKMRSSTGTSLPASSTASVYQNESIPLQDKNDSISGQILLRSIKANKDIGASLNNNKIQAGYQRLINPAYANFMDNLIDLCENKPKLEHNKGKYEIFKIPKPSTSNSKMTQTNDKCQPRQSFQDDSSVQSNNANEQFDRGKMQGLDHNSRSLDSSKNYTEWNKTKIQSFAESSTADSASEREVHCVDAACKQTASDPSESEKKVVSPVLKVDLKRKAQTLDFKDYTEWKNFMDSGTLNKPVKENVKKGCSERPKQKRRKLLPDTVIVIDDDTEDVTKENVWTGADNVKSCLGLNLKIPRPRQYKKEDYKESNTTTKSQEESIKVSVTSNTDVSANDENHSNLQNESQTDLMMKNKQNSILVSLLEKVNQSKTTKVKEGDGNTTKENDVDQSAKRSVAKSATQSSQTESQQLIEEYSINEVDTKKSNKNFSEEDKLRKTYRNIVLNMSQKPMHRQTADALVTEILKEENLRKSTEDLTNLIVKLVRESTNLS